jgi:NADH-quinone oxidoreductase subunit M
VLIGSFPTRPVFTVLATVGIILAALYVLLMYQRTMHGPPRGVLLEPAEGTTTPGATGGGTATLTAPAAPRLRARDLSRREIAVAAPMVALIIALGVYPQPLVDLIEPAVAATMSDVGSDPAGTQPAADPEGTD